MGSNSRRTLHIDIRFYFVKDRIAAGELSLEYCPTDDMWGDYFTKPSQGAKFIFFRRVIMNEPGVRSVLRNEENEEEKMKAEDIFLVEKDNGGPE